MLIAGKLPRLFTTKGRFRVSGRGDWDIKWGWPYGSGYTEGVSLEGWGDNDGRTIIQDPLELTLLFVETISFHESRS